MRAAAPTQTPTTHGKRLDLLPFAPIHDHDFDECPDGFAVGEGRGQRAAVPLSHTPLLAGVAGRGAGAQLALGRGLGRLAYWFARRERRVAAINIALCLPELDAHQRQTLLEQHFGSLGCAIFETAMVWWASAARWRRMVQFEGTEHLRAALEQGHGALLLTAHFTTLESGARALTLLGPTSIMYLTPKNPLIAELSRRGRARHTVQAISSEQIRDLLHNLKRNLPVWYAPDQRFTDKNSALVPLFGHPAASNVATSRLARISGAPVLPFFPARRSDNRGYVMRILPPFANFPTADPVADTRRFHELIEAEVRRNPEQYLWAYKRLRRPGYDPYAADAEQRSVQS
jgi:Kdo2-lipid IVA lauroyltransferase/acyltransferase